MIKKGRFTEERELSVTTVPTIRGAMGGEQNVDDYNVTVHTRKGIIGD